MDKLTLTSIVMDRTEGYARTIGGRYDNTATFKEIQQRRRKKWRGRNKSFARNVVTGGFVDEEAHAKYITATSDGIMDVHSPVNERFSTASMYISSVKSYLETPEKDDEDLLERIKHNLVKSVEDIDTDAAISDNIMLPGAKKWFPIGAFAVATTLVLAGAYSNEILYDPPPGIDTIFYIFAGAMAIVGAAPFFLKENVAKYPDEIRTTLEDDYKEIKGCDLDMLKEVLDENKEKLLGIINSKC